MVTIGENRHRSDGGAPYRAGERHPEKFRDHAWFVAFVPLKRRALPSPSLAEHMGHGGSAAAPLAKDVIEAYVKAYPQVLQGHRQAGGPKSPCGAGRYAAEDVMIDRVIDSRGWIVSIFASWG